MFRSSVVKRIGGIRSQCFSNDSQTAFWDTVLPRPVQQFRFNDGAYNNLRRVVFTKMRAYRTSGKLEVIDPDVRIKQPLHYQASRVGSVPCSGRSNSSPANAPAVLSKYRSGQRPD